MLHMMLLLTQGQLSIFGNAIKTKLKRVASSLKKRPNLSLSRSRHRTCIGALFERTSRNSNSGSVIPAQKWILLLDCAKKHNVSFFARHKLDEKINNGRHIRVAFVSVSKRVFVRNYSYVFIVLMAVMTL